MKLRALKAIKPHKYGTRHLVAGEEYEVPPRHAIALVAGRKAQFADKLKRAEAKIEAPSMIEEPAQAQAEPALEAPPDIDSLRIAATQLGIDVDGRWGVARLQYEITKAKG